MRSTLYSRGSTGSLSSASTAKTHVDTAQRFAPDEAAERFDAQGEFAEGEATLGAEAALAQPVEMVRQGVVRPVDDAQILRAAALDRRLHHPFLAARDEIEQLLEAVESAALRSRLRDEPDRDFIDDPVTRAYRAAVQGAT